MNVVCYDLGWACSKRVDDCHVAMDVPIIAHPIETRRSRKIMGNHSVTFVLFSRSHNIFVFVLFCFQLARERFNCLAYYLLLHFNTKQPDWFKGAPESYWFGVHVVFQLVVSLLFFKPMCSCSRWFQFITVGVPWVVRGCG